MSTQGFVRGSGSILHPYPAMATGNPFQDKISDFDDVSILIQTILVNNNFDRSPSNDILII